MEYSFLLSDVPDGFRHQLLGTITGGSCHALAFVKDFEELPALQNEFPGVVWIVLDINRNAAKLIKFLKVIPTPNYIVNFNGPDFLQNSLHAFQSCGIAFKERERGHPELTLDGIVGDNDGEECRFLVNVVERRSELKKKTKAFTKKVGKLAKGAKKQLSSLARDDDDSTEENEPLIQNRVNPDADSSSQGFFASLFSLCCPCLFPAPEPVYCFRNLQELRLHIHSEQLAEVTAAFKKLHEKSLSSWNRDQLELRSEESQRTEELVARIDALRQQEEKDLTNVKAGQNSTTRERLSNVLSEDTLRRIEASRSRQTKGTVKYDADRAYREGHGEILKQVATEKAKLRETHYSKLVEEQLQKLTEIQLKYQRKMRELEERDFSNRTF